ncbi:FAD binding domain-containing protein [Magnaporthiopsis poae ATCC 64411]|uniref:FAD binding domain-containing protein n=1 Tax=Magnaporthiopsis poae (strain ATCC 64411 / 73-15) TaxID=644358 RepID=A0A0C4EBJ3_MAGP6|nr:FAD binding domain-containing protein [Magnaporthiopsis poae ATCC 64411]
MKQANCARGMVATAQLLLLVARVASGLTFPYETVRLQEADTQAFPAVSFGNKSAPIPLGECRSFPGDVDWPSDAEWAALDSVLEGRLLKPTPLGAACDPSHPAYSAARCQTLVRDASRTRTLLDDPLTILNVWPQGDTCRVALPGSGPGGADPPPCTRGGFPEYVVNATTVRDVQAAVNFARNKNLRLVVKNTGHDFGGRSVGAGSLSIWTHHLKESRYMESYDSAFYSGRAIQLGSGIEAWEMSNLMVDHDITITAPGGNTVGGVGGWFLGGGHTTITSRFGLGADQVVELNVVTADGSFVTANGTHNTDLFWALRGSGVGSFGIVTSAVFKAYAPIGFAGVQLEWQTTGTFGTVVDKETFWRGINAYFKFGINVGLANGVDFNYIRNQGNDTYSFTTRISFPGKTPQQIFDLLAPMFSSLQAAGVNVTNRLPAQPTPVASRRGGTGDSLGNLRYASRLWPRSLWADEAGFERAMAAVRASVEEGGYTFHGLLMNTDPATVGMPVVPPNSVSAAWRATAMHASVQDRTALADLSPAEFRAANERVLKYSGAIRAATPGGGAYINEGDSLEPGWQDNFYGLDIYPRLLRVKRALDPWGLFWAPTAVGSEDWEVRTADGRPMQNGRLCRHA